MKRSITCLALGLALALMACDDDGGQTTGGDTSNTPDTTGGDTTGPNPTPSTYAFDSAFEPGTSSVAYSGQIMRHVLIADLALAIGAMTDEIDSGDFEPVEGEVRERLDFWFRFDSESTGDVPLLLTTDPPAVQQVYNDVGTGKDLVGKLAGNDDVTDHKDWFTEFAGWSDESIAEHGGAISNPEGLVIAFFETLEEQAVARVAGDIPTGPDGQDLPVHVTPEGQDLQQLIQKFLLGAVALSQGADDYLDDDVQGKGLLSDNSTQDGGSPYTSLEHQWDEGFGYFGAAADYGDYTDEEIAGKGGRDGWSSGYYDTDGDGAIDLLSEYNFGASTNAAKRDLGANEATDFTGDAFEGFLEGRAIIHAAAGRDLTDAEMDELKAWRDQAIGAWEGAYAATAVHYINDTLQDMGKIGTDEYSITDHAKHWSELKGFSLGFQFNPHSPLSDADFATFHTLVGDAPVLADADEATRDAYVADLLAARAILRDAYGFAEANMGDDAGEGGW